MPRVSTAYVKNIVRRGFAELVDPEPDAAAVARLWAYFGAECAYCGRPVSRGSRGGRVDHLVAASAGGGNHLGNRVLACGPCNDDEKRDRDWREFLVEKVPEPAARARRAARILAWVAQHAAPVISPAVATAAHRGAAEVNALFEAHVAAVRDEMRRVATGGGGRG